MAALVLDLPWHHLDCIVDCLQLKEKVCDCLPLTVVFSIWAGELQTSYHCWKVGQGLLCLPGGKASLLLSQGWPLVKSGILALSIPLLPSTGPALCVLVIWLFARVLWQCSWMVSFDRLEFCSCRENPCSMRIGFEAPSFFPEHHLAA